MLDRAYWFFGALAFTVAIGALVEGDMISAVIAACVAASLVWAGFRVGRRL